MNFIRKSLTFCEEDNLLNEGVATILCKSVRVVTSSHLINHCIAFNSASNLARLQDLFIRKTKRKFIVRFYRYKIKPTIRRRTIIDERLIIIQPHIGMRAKQ
jgi:hypothetical protein